MHLKSIRNYKNMILYMISIGLCNCALGIFSLMFNLHIATIIDSKVFMSNFYLIGNISMAVGAAIVGRIIDKYDKRYVLIIATSGAAIFFAGECFINNIWLLYFVSILYGIMFSLLMSIHTPFIMSYANEKDQPYVLSISSSVKIVMFTMGTIIAGNIPDTNRENIYILGLTIASLLYFLSVLPLFGIDTNKQSSVDYEIKEHCENERSGFRNNIIGFSFVLPFFFLGLLIFLSPYMNIYLKNRYNMSLKSIAIVLSIIEVLPAITNIALTKLYKFFEVEKIVRIGCIIGVVIYVLLGVFNNATIQVFLLVCTTVLSSFLFPQISRIIIKKFNEKHIGVVSGFANAFYNAGDAAGTYVEGICVLNGIYVIPFFVAALIFMFFVALSFCRSNV